MIKEELFSTPVWMFNPGDQIKGELDKLYEETMKLETNNPKDKALSVVDGWRINNPHRLTNFRVIKDYIIFISKKVLVDDLKKDTKNRELLISSWLNVHPSGGMNTSHHHGNALLSGVFYIKTPLGSGNFIIKDPRPGAYFETGSGLLPIGTETKHMQTTRLSFEPKEGQAYVFPGYLEHYVEPTKFENDQYRRISIGFNINMTRPSN